jgi:hypothetical protein
LSQKYEDYECDKDHANPHDALTITWLIVFVRTHSGRSAFSFGPIPKFELYYSAIDKATGELLAVSESAVGVLADAAKRPVCRGIVSKFTRSAVRSMSG